MTDSYYIIPFHSLMRQLELDGNASTSHITMTREQLENLLRSMLRCVAVDETWYRNTYPDVDEAISNGKVPSAKDHFVASGYFEGRKRGRVVVDQNCPQRYGTNYPRYIALGGLARPEDDVLRFGSDLARFFFFYLAFDQLVKEGLSGDLLELGVYKGHTAILLAKIARHLKTTAYLLDTFEGFSPKDIRGIDVGARDDFADTSLEAVRAFVGEERTCFIKGYFPDTASEIPSDASFCLIHIDCDLYAPTRSALELFYPRLIPGGFLIVHDYSSLHWPGTEKAVDEFLANKPEASIPLPDSSGSVVIRKQREVGPDNNWLVRKRAAG
jgi:O-methyltransferase